MKKTFIPLWDGFIECSAPKKATINKVSRITLLCALENAASINMGEDYGYNGEVRKLR